MRWDRGFGRTVGTYAGHLFTSHCIFLLTLLLSALAALCVQLLQRWVDDADFTRFAQFIHIVLLAADGLIFIIWLLRWIVRAVKEEP